MLSVRIMRHGEHCVFLRSGLLINRVVELRDLAGGGGAARCRHGAPQGRPLPWRVRQRDLESVDRRVASIDLPGATLGATGMAGHSTARESLRSVAGDRAHDGTGRAALPRL